MIINTMNMGNHTSKLDSKHKMQSAAMCYQPKSNNQNFIKHCAGMSLIELLVAMVISLFLVGGLIQMFVQNKTSYTLQDGIARAQENGRLSLYFVEKHLRRAAHPWDALPSINGFARDQVAGNAFTNNNTIPVEGGAAADALVIQLQAPGGGTTDCAGRNIAADEYVAMHFFINGTGLACESITTDPAMAVALDSAILIDGVDNLQFTYGVDADDDGIPDGAYSDAGAGLDWEQVVAVHVEATIPVEPANLSNNREMVFSTSVPIRNQISRE